MVPAPNSLTCEMNGHEKNGNASAVPIRKINFLMCRNKIRELGRPLPYDQRQAKNQGPTHIRIRGFEGPDRTSEST